MKTKPAAKSPTPNFEAQLREQLHAQAEQRKQPLFFSSLLASAVGLGVITAVVLLFWFTQRQLNQPQTVAPAQQITIEQARAQGLALDFLQGDVNKPIGGKLLEPLDVQIVPISVQEGFDLMGRTAIAEYQGSNIIWTETAVDRDGPAWLVQAWGVWEAFGSEEQLYRFGAAVIEQATGQLIIAGASSHRFVDLGGSYSVDVPSFPPSDSPYEINTSGTPPIWLVNQDGIYTAFDGRSPYADETRERCLFIWEAVNGRFVDPCSGDKWSLTGELLVEESSSLWSNRDLDQYYLSQNGDSVIIWLDYVQPAGLIPIELAQP